MTIEQKLSTRDLIARLTDNPVGFVGEGYKQGLNLSRWLEENSPSEPNDSLDAFERCLREAGIVTRSDPAAGVWASPAKVFFDGGPANRTLYTEFFARQWRKASFASSQQRGAYLSTDNPANSWDRPYADAAQARWDFQLAPAIPLSELVAITTPIEGQDYRSFYMVYDATQLRAFRVGETAEIPVAKLTDAEHTIRLKKYGRGLLASYEQLRRMRVDKLALQIGYMAVQSEMDKVAAALAILVAGDGNSTPTTAATNYNLTTLDTDATAGTLTLKGWLSYKLKFTNPYVLTTALMTEATALQLALLNVGNANVPLANFNAGGMVQSLTPINTTSDGVRYGWTSDAPALTIVGFDRRFALERLTEIGGQIDEMERFITNQTQLMTMTEVEGYAILDGNATKTLTVSA